MPGIDTRVLIVVIKLFFNVTRGLGEEVDREGDGLIEK
jgi:hypothetical protein